MKKVIFSLMVMVLLASLVVAGCAKPAPAPAPAPTPAPTPAPAPAQTALEQLYEEAKKEGEFIHWTPSGGEEFAKVYKVFSERYPGIKGSVFEIQTAEALERIITEQTAGKYDVDSAKGSLKWCTPILERELAVIYDWVGVFNVPPVNVLPEWVVLDGRGILRSDTAHCIAYNTNLVSPQDLPKSKDLKVVLEEMLQPKWKGNMMVERRAYPFGLWAYYTGDEWMTEYMKKLLEQEPIISKGATESVVMLGAGEAMVSWGVPLAKVVTYRDFEGLPVNFVPLDPVVVSSTFVWVVKNAPHPNAAKLWVGWAGSAEGKKAFAEAKSDVLLGPGCAGDLNLELVKQGVTFLRVPSEKELVRVGELCEKYSKILTGL